MSSIITFTYCSKWNHGNGQALIRTTCCQTKKSFQLCGCVHLLAWKAYCRGDEGTQTWSAREQDKPIAVPPHVADPIGR
jgi:hypothetical protein